MRFLEWCALFRFWRACSKELSVSTIGVNTAKIEPLIFWGPNYPRHSTIFRELARVPILARDRLLPYVFLQVPAEQMRWCICFVLFFRVESYTATLRTHDEQVRIAVFCRYYVIGVCNIKLNDFIQNSKILKF